MKKRGTLVLVSLLLAGIVAGCAAPVTDEPAATGQAGSDMAGQTAAEDVLPDTEVALASQEISVVTTFGTDDPNCNNYEASYKAWEKATGNTVSDNSAAANEEWKAAVNQSFETGDEPDVLFFFAYNDANTIIGNGQVVPLEEIRAEFPAYASNMKDDFLPVSTADGKQYVVPVNGYWESMFVNQEILKECGVAMPAPDYTWEQFLADCEKIKAAGYTPIAGSLALEPHYWFEFAVYDHGDTANHLELPASSGDEVGKKWVAGLNDIKDLYERGYFQDDTLTATHADACKLMYNGGAAFLVDGSWRLNGFLDNVPADKLQDFSVAYVAGQGERRASDFITGISMGYYITRKAWDDPNKRQAAVSFVEWMTSDETVALFTTTQATALAAGNPPLPASASPLELAAMDTVGSATGVVGAVQDLISNEAKTSLFVDNMKRICTGEITAEKALDEAIPLF